MATAWRLNSLILLGLVVIACSGGGGTASTTAPGDGLTTASAGNGEAEITIQNFSFTGATDVSVGTTVIVKNEDGVTHTWTSTDGTFNSGAIAGGSSFEFTFDEPGEYSYFCSIHTQMTGTLTVEG